MSSRFASPDTPARTGVWVGIGAIAMSFAAYTSAMIVRGGSAPHWQHFRLPPILYLNTVVLLASSVTLEAGRRQLTRAANRPERTGDPQLDVPAGGLSWLYLTLALGIIFLAGQCLAWLDLAAQGLFLATNPSSSFFYVFTAMHGLHLIGGLAGLAFVLRRVSRGADTSSLGALGAAALYWHFMGVLWLYLLGVLALWV
jgi:cytochrome c oxidase subunit III